MHVLLTVNLQRPVPLEKYEGFGAAFPTNRGIVSNLNGAIRKISKTGRRTR